MTYFGVLIRFIIVPILVIAGMEFLGLLRNKDKADNQNKTIWKAIFIHAVIAVLYTTPWDNYLVANRIWWYDAELVTGLKIGYVPIEEYVFFVLQPILGGLWLWTINQRNIIPLTASSQKPALMSLASASVFLLWLGIVIAFLSGWERGTYFALELIWALPPLILQLVFGADILWKYRRQIFWSIVPLTFYLSFVDYLAIGSGTWTINPELSLGYLIGGILPLEEVLFFILTNSLITFGITLMLAPESRARIVVSRKRITHLVWKH